MKPRSWLPVQPATGSSRVVYARARSRQARSFVCSYMSHSDAG